MTDETLRKYERAVAADPSDEDALLRLRLSRCRSGQCCAGHALRPSFSGSIDDRVAAVATSLCPIAYLVVSGHYDDYTVHSVHLSHARAEAECLKRGSSPNNIHDDPRIEGHRMIGPNGETEPGAWFACMRSNVDDGPVLDSHRNDWAWPSAAAVVSWTNAAGFVVQFHAASAVSEEDARRLVTEKRDEWLRLGWTPAHWSRHVGPDRHTFTGELPPAPVLTTCDDETPTKHGMLRCTRRFGHDGTHSDGALNWSRIDRPGFPLRIRPNEGDPR